MSARTSAHGSICFPKNRFAAFMKAAFACAMLAIAALAPQAAPAASSTIVVSQIYGAGGNSGATWQNDYIELFNLSGSPVSVSGWSVQYASAGGSGNFSAVALSGSIPAGGYYLVKLAGGAAGAVLPAADASGSINMSGSAGKVIVANVSTGLACNGGSTPCSAAQLAQIVDLVGYGTGTGGANFFEGSAAAPTISATIADFRAANGCTDTDNNSADFATAVPAPRNSASPVNACGVVSPTPPSGTGAANPASVSAGGTTLLTVATTQGTNPSSAISSVVTDLSAIGGSSTQAFFDDGSNGDATAGDGVYSFGATVAAGTASGAKSLPVTITDALARTGSTSIALSVSLPPLPIMQIQGHGAASPYAGPNGTLGALVTTPDAAHTNIVTAVAKNGFYMQDSAGDGDVTTSDAVFVFTSSAPSAHVGDAVSVSGQVQEFNGATEITNKPVVTVLSTGNPVPAPYLFDLNAPTADPTTGICLADGSTVDPPADGYQASNFACLDGMLVAIDDGVVTGATFASGADGVHAGTPSGFYATLGSEPRPFRETGVIYPGLGVATIPTWSGAPQIIEVFYSGLGFSPAGHIYDAGQHFSISGVIQNFKGTYEIYPLSLDAIGTAPPYPVPVADSVNGTLTIGTQNMLHFFNNVADGADTSQYTDNCAGTGASDSCPTAAQYQTRLAKMSKQIREVLKAPVALGVEEVENYGVLSDLANRVLADGGPHYQPYTIPGNDPGGINLGVLVRSDVIVNSVTQLFKGSMTNSCSSNPPCLLNDRPPLLLDAIYNGYRFNLLVIYDRSLINLGVLDYVGTKRTEQAVQVASVARALQSGGTLIGAGNARQDASGFVTTGAFDIVGNPSLPLVVVGDFNAYEFTDGYVDVTGMISGTAVQAENLYWDQSGTYVAPAPPLFDSGSAANPADHYSYNFGGYAQEIDHILLSSLAQNDFIAISNAHGNSDVSEAGPAVLDPTTAVRTSDHDGQVVTLGYVVTPVTADGGSASPAIRTVSKNASAAFTFTPDAAHHFKSTSDNCGTGGSFDAATGVYATGPVTANCSVSVTFALDTFTVIANAGSGGSVDQPSHSVDYNTATSFTFTPDAGYHFDAASDTCGAGGSFDGATGIYTTGPVTADCAVSVSFAPNPVDGVCGTDNGATLLAPPTNLCSVGVAGVVAGDGHPYTWACNGANGGQPATCSATLKTWTVTPSASSNGAISPNSAQIIDNGAMTSFTLTPDAGFAVASASGCDGTLSGNVYTTGPISIDCTVSATFGPASYRVTPVAGPHGTITPSTTQIVGYQAILTFAANPAPSYKTKSVSGCNATVKNNKITTGPITADCSLTVSFGK
ncbi:MAG TPA: lamin tail domain-containing protein [Rudaea sp.]|nr:lamin tail domain-containing protein [Rudaea sp.]